MTRTQLTMSEQNKPLAAEIMVEDRGAAVLFVVFGVVAFSMSAGEAGCLADALADHAERAELFYQTHLGSNDSDC